MGPSTLPCITSLVTGWGPNRVTLKLTLANDQTDRKLTKSRVDLLNQWF